MKIKRFLQGLAAFAVIALFAGCADILDSKTAEKSNLKENTSVSISFDSKGRYISAGSFELDKITSWKISFEPTGDSDEKSIELAWTSGSSDSSSSSPSLYYSGGVLNAKLIPVGTYNIALEGSYSEGNGAITVSGTKEGVSVSSESAKNSITVLVGLKKDSSDNGSLALSFDAADISNYASGLLVTLKNIQTGDIEYSTDKNNLVFTSSSDSVYALTGEDIAPGWYKLEFYYNDSVKIEIPNDKMMVEIASGIKTTDSDIKISSTSVKKYYATNGTSESAQNMNGLAVSSRKNLTALLEKLTKTWPDVSEVEIFMDSAPVIDIKTFNELKEALEDSKKCSIYLGESQSIALASDPDTNTVTTALSGSVCLVATDGNEKLEVNGISVENGKSFDITLKNGACVNDTGATSILGNLNIYAVKDSEDGTPADNFTAYVAAPFFYSASEIDTSRFLLFEYGSKKVSDQNTVISVSENNSCEFYIKPASMEGITAESSADLSIEAYYTSGSDSETYSSGSVIPYESSDLNIKLTASDGIEIEKCLWYLNGDSIDDSITDELIYFDPTQNDSLKIDGTNVVSCFVSVEEKLYLCELRFTFKTPSRSAAVWASGTYSLSMKQIYDYTDSDAAESTIKENLTSKYYCFDKNYNLWTVTSGSALALNKYSMKVSSNSYSTDSDLTAELSEITGSPADMCYDAVNGYIYLLVNGDSAATVYAVSTGDKPAIAASATMDLSALGITLTNIAVNGNDFYFADSSCNVYKATAAVASGGIAVGTPGLVKSLASSEILEGYDSLKHDDYDSISITDLQFGDGLGYDTGNVYALVKEASSSVGLSSSNDYFYSRGALVKISTETSSIEKFGWTSEVKEFNYTRNTGSYKDYYCIPDATDSANTDFFGPAKFCAVVPKKIVIVDDGFYLKAVDGSSGALKNKDSIVEFDIDGSTLSRGAAGISVSFDIGTTDYYYTEN